MYTPYTYRKTFVFMSELQSIKNIYVELTSIQVTLLTFCLSISNCLCLKNTRLCKMGEFVSFFYSPSSILCSVIFFFVLAKFLTNTGNIRYFHIFSGEDTR